MTARVAFLLLWSSAAAAASLAAGPAAQAVAVSVYSNSALFGAPAASYAFDSLGNISFPPLAASFSAEILTQLTFPTSDGYYVFECAPTTFTRGYGFVYVDDHLVCNTGISQPYANPTNSTDGSQANPIYRRGNSARPAVVRARLFVNDNNGAGGGDIAFGLAWCSPAGPSAGCMPAPVPASALAAGLPPLEASRAALQGALTAGWGLWLRGDWLAAVGLPSGAKLTLLLCRVSTADCLQSTQTAVEISGRLRLGLHAYDRSIAQLYAAFADGGLNASVTLLGGTGGASLLVEPIGDCGGNCSDYTAAVAGSFAWGRAGNVSVVQTRSAAARAGSSAGEALLVSPAGLPAFTLFASAASAPQPLAAAGAASAPPTITVSLGGGAVAFAIGSGPPSVAAVQSAATAAAAAEAARYSSYGALAEVAQATQAAGAWNVIYIPTEAGPVASVSRSWNLATTASDALRSEWGGVFFGWDSFLTAYLLGATTRDAAYSTLIQAARSVKAAGGFVSNFQAGGAKSVDRTEPIVGAQVLARLFKKYGDAWIVELLLDDLIDWLDWVWRERRLEGAAGDIICLGSDPVPGFDLYSAGTMQGARYESGLDNSPMYDGYFFSNDTHHMQLADVGASSLFVADSDALAGLAAAVNRTADAATLSARADAVRAQIAAQLWDEEQGIFVNTFPNGSHSARVSPTSFYALAARAATDAQAARMATEWALNSSRFCLSSTWPAGVSDDCYWGLPSISADDPAFPAGGYWRQPVWGPMVQLSFWAFSEYAHVPEVAAARAALVQQMQGMFLAQWRLNRHVCESFSPKRNATECSASKMYTWGALAGLIAIQDAGLY
jgi:hypothetical protein